MNQATFKTMIAIDPGMLARIEHEATVTQERTGKRPSRIAVMRELFTEALDTRSAGRGETVPTAEPANVV